METGKYLKLITDTSADKPCIIIRNICPTSGKVVIDSIEINIISQLISKQKNLLLNTFNEPFRVLFDENYWSASDENERIIVSIKTNFVINVLCI